MLLNEPVRWRLFSYTAILLGFAYLTEARAQSTSIQERVEEPSWAKPAETRPVARDSETITRPQVKSASIDYPQGARGEQEVVLELTISKDGVVTRARAVSGDEPFASQATGQATRWSFEPARRNGKAIAARIRFLAKFVPPAPKPSPRVASPDTRGGTAKEATGERPSNIASSEAESIDVMILGEREPLRQDLSSAEIREMPGAFGDPYRAIEALPGVVPTASGLPYYYVRGAPPGNVGYFFDGVPVPYLFHFAAGPGVINPAFVERVELYPGAYPARYGRATGAIVAGDMAAPQYRVRAEASIRDIDSSAMVEVPWGNGRGSAMFGGRYAYTGPIVSLIVPKLTVDYWDYQARAHYELGTRDSVEVVAFGAGDFASQKKSDRQWVPSNDPTFPGGGHEVQLPEHEEDLADVTFHRLDLRFDHRLSSGRWRNAITFGFDRTGYDNRSVYATNRLFGMRSEWEMRTSRAVEWRAGADVLRESLSQAVGTPSLYPTDNTTSISTPLGKLSQATGAYSPARRDVTAGAWGDVVLDVTPAIEFVQGLRADVFVSGNDVAVGVDPRASLRVKVTKRLTMTHGVAVVHQTPSFVVPIPGVKPSLSGGLQSSVQSSAGVNYLLPAGFDASATLFQNVFYNMTDYLSLSRLKESGQAETTDLRSTGHAYGAELMIRRGLSRDGGGFISYTLSRSMRSSGKMQGPAASDRTHVLNVVVTTNLGRNWRLGGRWMFYTGVPVSVAYLEAARTPPRTPPFWRLDFKLQKRWILAAPNAWWGVSLEVLNTTLNEETLRGGCSAFRCTYDTFGPITIPAIGVEGAL